MRYRAQDASGDYTFGLGSANFLVDNVPCVTQAILTGLRLWQGEWFLDLNAGMPWAIDVIGYDTQSLYDLAIQNQILSTEGVTGINSYSSTLNKATRTLTISVDVQTEFGPTSLSIPVTFAPPPSGGYGVGGYGTQPYGA